MVPKINTIYGKTPSDLRIKIKGMLSTYKFDTSNKVHLTNGNKNIVIGFSRTFVAKDWTTHLLIFKLPETKLIYKKWRGYYVNIDDMPDISLKF